MVLSVRNREVGSHGGNVSLREEGFGFKASAISHALLVQTCSAALRKDVLFCRLEGHLRQAHGESASGGRKGQGFACGDRHSRPEMAVFRVCA